MWTNTKHNNILITMTTKKQEYICIRDEQIQDQSRKIAELDARADYKDKRLDTIEEKIDKLTDEVQNIMLKGINDDNTINQRITALETSQNTTYKLIMLVIALIPILDILFGVKF